MQNHHCSNLLPNGVCKKTGKLCDEALPGNTQPPQIPNWLSTEYSPPIPPACKGCSNHPSNGGTGICFCTLGSTEFTAGTTSGTAVPYTTYINIAEG